MSHLVITFVCLFSGLLTAASETTPIGWPPPPDEARVVMVGEISFDQLTEEKGFFGKLGRFLGGKTEADEVALPFDVLVADNSILSVCQNLPALVQIDPHTNTFKVYTSKDRAMIYPVALCEGGEGRAFISDSEGQAVFLFADGRVEPFITTGLSRPTGLAWAPADRLLYVVDTGDHTVKIFTYEGVLIGTLGGRDQTESILHFPTFAAASSDGSVLINDALNYKIRRFNQAGALLTSFGREGDSPGSFARPKGIAEDSDGHLYVVDNLFDNVQVFDRTGRLLLVIGSSGQAAGQFWSPAGIDVHDDTIYIADTHNNRIQILRYLGGKR